MEVKNGVPEGFKRTYSAINNPINSTNMTSQINEQLNGFMLNISNQLTNFKYN